MDTNDTLPRSSIDAAMASLVLRRDDSIRHALDFAAPGWTQRSVAGRLTRVTQSRVDLILLDGKPLIEFHPVDFSQWETRGDSYVQTLTQKYRIVWGST